jgi:hypothetical protein
MLLIKTPNNTKILLNNHNLLQLNTKKHNPGQETKADLITREVFV